MCCTGLRKKNDYNYTYTNLNEWFIFTETESVFREVQTGYLNKRDKVSPIKELNTDIQTV